MQNQEKIIAKYDKTKIKNYNSFAIVPLEIFQKGISREAVGLYIFLSSYAGVSPHYEGKKSLIMHNTQDILQLLRWKANKSDLQELLDELQSAKVIQIYNRPEPRNKFDIIFPRLKRDENVRFVKLYASTVRKIESKATGKWLLRRLVAYAGIRAGIFENSTSSQIFEQSLAYVAQILEIDSESLRHSFKWLRDNDIVAFYKCKVTKELGYERYYYAEYRDWKKLKDVINGYIKQDVVREVIA